MSGVYDSEEGEDLESFKLSNEDLLNEFDPNRPRFKQTKQDALYGIWATEEESGWGSFKKKKASKYSEPVSFVSGGMKEETPKDDVREEEEKTSTESNINMVKSKNLMSNVTAAKAPSYSVQSRGKKEKLDTQFAGFERHTKGIGTKLLQKMGYQFGKGLGKSGQGIVNPIEAHKRTRKAGLGAAGTERTKQSFIHFPLQDSSKDEEQEEHVSQWRKGGEEKQKKPKYKYKTLEELKKSGKVAKSKAESTPHTGDVASLGANIKVIDLTGKEKKVFTGYHAIAGRTASMNDQYQGDITLEEYEKEAEMFSCPELLHNLDTLIEETEQKILSNDRQKRYESDRLVTLKHQEQKLEETISSETKEINRVETLLRMITHCEEKLNQCHPDDYEDLLNYFADVLEDLQEKYFAEYKMFELNDLIKVMISPLLQKYFDKWDLLKEPAYGILEIKRWKLILEPSKSNYSGENAGENKDCYQHLLWDAWMPIVRACIIKWDPHDCDSIMEFIEQWQPLLPPWMLENILTQLILPQLQQQVDKWNPLTDPVPLHSWIHPWLPYMTDSLELLYGPIRNKLTAALQMWHPHDPSARIILEPWFKVFNTGSWDAFISKTILPKLSKCLQEMTIDPRQQEIKDFECVISWQSLMPIVTMVTILEKHFFPKWMKALSLWLNSNPDFDEVTAWYTGWKTMFPLILLENSFVKDRFKHALEIMSRAVDGQQKRESVAKNEEDVDEVYPPTPPPLSQNYQKLASSRQHSSAIPTRFKDLVQKRAEECGILFLPIPKQDGQNLYRLGNEIIYIDNGVIFYKAGSTFLPISLQDIINKSLH